MNEVNPVSPADDSLIIPVDQEHGALRLVVIALFAVSWIVSFLVLSLLITNQGINIIAIVIGFLIAYAISAASESQLKRRWPSGRVIQVQRDAVQLIRGSQVEREMRSQAPVNTLFWSFQVSRRARVPKGWSMLACALEHESQYLIAYSFMSPQQVESYEEASRFKMLSKLPKAPPPGRGTAPTAPRDDLRVAGEQRRLRDAESQRWLNGAEMTPQDFMRYVRRIETQFPEWMPVN